MMEYICEILVQGRGSTTSSQICLDLKYPLCRRCNVMECICEILVGGEVCQVKSA